MPTMINVASYYAPSTDTHRLAERCLPNPEKWDIEGDSVYRNVCPEISAQLSLRRTGFGNSVLSAVSWGFESRRVSCWRHGTPSRWCLGILVHLQRSQDIWKNPVNKRPKANYTTFSTPPRKRIS